MEEAIVKAQAELDAFNEDTEKAGQFLALAKKYTDFTELTTPMLHEFIDRILVHAPDRSSGEREQEVEIYLKFIGRFDVPLPEPTPENWRMRNGVASVTPPTTGNTCGRKSGKRSWPPGRKLKQKSNNEPYAGWPVIFHGPFLRAKKWRNLNENHQKK